MSKDEPMTDKEAPGVFELVARMFEEKPSAMDTAITSLEETLQLIDAGKLEAKPAERAYIAGNLAGLKAARDHLTE